MIKCLIIEDEDLAARRLTRLLTEVDEKYSVFQRCQSVREAVEVLGQNNFDLLFLDIHLTDGLSFEIFNRIKNSTPIIFTTAYDQYAIEAFKQNSIDYLLKPIQKEGLKKALEKFEALHRREDAQVPDYQALLEVLNKQSVKYKDRFLVQVADKIRSIDQEDIHYFYADNKTTFLITNANKRYYVNYRISDLEQKLNPEYFFRVNRKIILRIDSFNEVLSYSRSKLKVLMKNPPSFDVFVPADKITAFKEWLND